MLKSIQLMLPFIKRYPIGTDEILLIKGGEGLDYYCCNSLLIGDVLIDTGFSNNYLKQIIGKFQINKVIFTHWHEDHIAGSSLLKNCEFISDCVDATQGDTDLKQTFDLILSHVKFR